MDNDLRITEAIVYLYTYSSDNHLTAWSVRTELQCSGKTEIQKRPALFRNSQSFVDCSMERSIRYIFFYLENIQHKLSSDYGLNIFFSSRFPYICGPSFSLYKPLQNVDFSKVCNMQFFFQELYSHIDKNSGEKFEDMFLVKIESKGTPLSDFNKIGTLMIAYSG